MIVKEKEYAKLEPKQKVYNLIELLDAKTNIKFYNINNELIYEGKVYTLYDKATDFDEMIINYIRFDYLSRRVVCVVEPEVWE